MGFLRTIFTVMNAFEKCSIKLSVKIYDWNIQFNKMLKYILLNILMLLN